MHFYRNGVPVAMAVRIVGDGTLSSPGISVDGNDRMDGVGIFFVIFFLRRCRSILSLGVVGKQMSPLKAFDHLKRGRVYVVYPVCETCAGLPVFDNEEIDDQCGAGHQQTVETIPQTAVAGEDGAGVFHTDRSFDE